MRGVQVSVLGAGDAFCAGGLHHSGYLVRSAGTSLLLDCGPSTLSALKRSGNDPDRIEAVFISHLHGDHFSGLPFLFLHYIFVNRRQRPLTLAGPPGTEERVQALYSAMYRHAASQPLPFPVEFVELEPGEGHKLDSANVVSFAVPHQETEISLGYRTEVDGRTIVYSGDTGWTEELLAQSEGSDLFVCECSYFETRTPFHLDYPRLRENREQFKTKRLLLTHLGDEVLRRRGEIELELAGDDTVIEL